MKVLFSLPILLFFLFMGLAAMERTPESDVESLVYAITTLLILTAIMFRMILIKKTNTEEAAERMGIPDSMEALKGNIVGRAEDGTAYYLIKMKGNTLKA